MKHSLSIRKIISFILFPVAALYAIGILLRNLLFSFGILKQQTHAVTTLCIGNISTGGTGKSPHVEYLIPVLKQEFSIAVLSRGYGRTSKGYILANKHDTAKTIGDEPFQMYMKNNEIPIAVCEDRNKGVEILSTSDQPPQIIILDDAMQHRKIQPSVSIMLTDFTHPFYNDFILPFGDLREFKSAYKRADIIIVTKCPKTLASVQKNSIIKDINPLAHQQVFFSYIEYGTPTALTNYPYAHFDDILVFSGIANPKPLYQHIGSNHRLHALSFPDHHIYTEKDLLRIKTEYTRISSNSKALITTEKDAARLINTVELKILKSLPLFYLPIEICFHVEDTPFNESILHTLTKTIKASSLQKKENM